MSEICSPLHPAVISQRGEVIPIKARSASLQTVSFALTLSQRPEKKSVLHAYGVLTDARLNREEWIDEALFLNFTRAQYFHLRAGVENMLNYALELYGPDSRAHELLDELQADTSDHVRT